MPNEERALATIDSVLNLKAIPGADNIEVAQVRGWDCVVKKGEFKPGDTCVYFEIDSVLPDEERYAFLKGSWSKKVKGYRLKARRLRGQVSYGLVLPTSNFPEIENADKRLGEDVTELLGIRIYDPPVTASGGTQAKGNFPSHLIPKTDAERIQNVNVMQLASTLKQVYNYDPMDYMTSASKLDTLELLTDNTKGGPYSPNPQVPGAIYVATEKLDGQSFTVYYNDGEVGYCSRNLELKTEDILDPDNTSSFSLAAKAYSWPQLMKTLSEMNAPGFPKNFAIQGEIVGPGVQGNIYELSAIDVYVFSIFDIDEQVYVAFDTMLQMCAAADLNIVPMEALLLSPMIVGSILRDRNIFQKMFEGKGSRLEGYVWRPFWQVPRAAMPTLQFKVISDEYLLRGK